MEVKLKKCQICKLDLPEDDNHFASRHDRGKKQYQSNCRECQKKYRKEHYLNNKEKYIKKAKTYRETFTEWIVDYKKNLKCEICDEDRYWVLDFHHKDPKEKDTEISVLIKSCNKKRILDEISKCMIVCSNCHRDLHHQERKASVV